MARPSNRKSRAKVTHGGGTGYIYPPFNITLDNPTIEVGTSEGTFIGHFSVEPADTILTLLDSDGNKFAMGQDEGGYKLNTGAVPTTVEDAGFQTITVRANYFGKVEDFRFSITITQAPYIIESIALDGDHTVAPGAAEDTIIGLMSMSPATPEGVNVVFSVTAPTDDTFKFNNDYYLRTGPNPLAAGDYSVTVTATANNDTENAVSETYTITVIEPV